MRKEPDEEVTEKNSFSPAALTDSLRERLFKSRTLVISGEINQRLAAQVVGQLLALDNENHNPVTIFINSQGGHVESGDTIHDIVKFIESPVSMVGTGWVASAGALIYISVPRERRFSLPNTRFLLHQPAGGVFGHASDIDIEAREIIAMRERLNKLLAKETGQTLEKIQEDTRRNFWLSAQGAKEYGLVGSIIEHASQLTR
jgi:ATP-dependent Clp protease, protease subunit